MTKNSTKNNIWAIVPAAGVGARMEADRPKQYLKIGNKTILEHTLEKLFQLPDLAGLIVCIAQQDEYWQTLNVTHKKLLQTVDGGETRAHSVLNGIRYLSGVAKDEDWVMVHDAARPVVSLLALLRLQEELKDHDVGGLLAVPVNDTVKLASENQTVQRTLDRSQLWYAQTPQMFKVGVLRQALEQALQKELSITDEASAIEFMGLKPKLVKGEVSNIKVTTAADMALVNMFIEN